MIFSEKFLLIVKSVIYELKMILMILLLHLILLFGVSMHIYIHFNYLIKDEKYEIHDFERNETISINPCDEMFW